MNTFNKKSLYAAVAGLGVLGVTGAAQAVSVNPDGLGQALVYPYYTVRNAVAAGAPYNTLLSVVNSTSSAKAVKVRFLEGKNSREVLDFNLYLSARDVWTTAVVPTADGAGIITADKSCTTPPVNPPGGDPSAFVNFLYSDDNEDGADTSLDRTREGYVEIIEMGNVTGVTATNITHSGGTPKSCTSITDTQAQADTVPGNGGLFGTATLINVQAGLDFAVDATALDNFSQTQIWQPPGSIFPDLSFVNPKVSVVTKTSPFVGPTPPGPGFNTTTYVTRWDASGTGPGNADPVSAVLMHSAIYNEYVLDAATKSGTDWVITMPTKHFYYDQASGEVLRLFQRDFVETGACDDVGITLYDREEQTKQSRIDFSPPRPNAPSTLCWEANVVTFNGSNVLGSKNVRNIDTLTQPPSFFNGWLAMDFTAAASASVHTLLATSAGSNNVTVDPAGTITAGVPVATSTTFTGLPTIGFAAITFNNGTLPDLTGGGNRLSTYGGVQLHKYLRTITPTP